MLVNRVECGRVGRQAGGDALMKHNYERGLHDGKEAHCQNQEEHKEFVGEAVEVKSTHWS